MKRALIAAAVVVGMTVATSSAMAQGRYIGGPRGVYRAPIGVQVGRQPVYRNYRSGYYRGPSAYRGRSLYRSPGIYGSRSFYRSPGVYGGRGFYGSRSMYRGGGFYGGPGFGMPARGFSLGIGF